MIFVTNQPNETFEYIIKNDMCKNMFSNKIILWDIMWKNNIKFY